MKQTFKEACRKYGTSKVERGLSDFARMLTEKADMHTMHTTLGGRKGGFNRYSIYASSDNCHLAQRIHVELYLSSTVAFL